MRKKLFLFISSELWLTITLLCMVDDENEAQQSLQHPHLSLARSLLLCSCKKGLMTSNCEFHLSLAIFMNRKKKSNFHIQKIFPWKINKTEFFGKCSFMKKGLIWWAAEANGRSCYIVIVLPLQRSFAKGCLVFGMKRQNVESTYERVKINENRIIKFTLQNRTTIQPAYRAKANNNT